MRRLTPFFLGPLVACETLPEQGITPDRALVEQAMRASRPGPLLDLPNVARAILPTEENCPKVEYLEFDQNPLGEEALGENVLGENVLGEPIHERWTGGCALSDGTFIDGSLELYEHDGVRWLAGDDFTVTHDGVLELYIDGAIEAVTQEDLLAVDASATWCGGDEAPCTANHENGGFQNEGLKNAGAVTVDLSYSIYPADGYPSAYDVTVNGVVSSGAAITVEGSWSVNLDTCANEPTNGAFALRRGERHDLTLDGALDCDACADWIVQGINAPDYCGVDF